MRTLNIFKKALEKRALRALQRQLDYQEKRASESVGSQERTITAMKAHSREVRTKVSRFRPIRAGDRALEVGSGSEGLIFFFGLEHAVGVDPLADHYAALLPWHSRVKTIAAGGESLPFHDSAFDIVLCDNVVDHAESPQQILREISRVLAPGGLLYFTVNVHSSFWSFAAATHSALRALGVPVEIGPFADHTCHLTLGGARKLFAGLPLRVVAETDDVDATRRLTRRAKPRHLGDLAKRVFFKNAVYEVIAIRNGG